jgi:hypothetical protein
MNHIVVVIKMMSFNWDLGRKRTLLSSTQPNVPYKFILVASCISDPLIGHGHHFGHMVHALCNIQALLMNSILCLGEQANELEELLTVEYIDSPISIYCAPNCLSLRQRWEHCVFLELLQIVPNLETCLREGANDDAMRITNLLHHDIHSLLIDVAILCT